MTEQQKHLLQMLEQQKKLVDDVTLLNTQLNTKKELLYKIQGVIEYLQQIGVSLPETPVESKEETQEEE